MKQLAAVLLCGGESRRMGRDKALVEWHGRALWEVQLEKLREVDASEIFVSARTDPAWLPADVELVLDEPPSRGAASGVAATLARCDSEHLLVVAIDLPLMTIAHLRSLYAACSGGVGAVPVIDNRAEPLAAIYPRKARALFAAALQTNDASLQPLVRELIDCGQLRVVEITGEERELYRNVNQPSDLAFA